jgi:alkanesulfonate monooxygenase SsuD/methylene tetrahydromethanopterin reductase-like flavin-dependent oxidoreductase (luciferase family)
VTRFAYTPCTNFGVYDSPVPGRDAVSAANEQFLLEAAAAEEAGFDGVWVPERHTRVETFLPSPLVLLAALAARTKRVTLTTTVMQPTYYNPMMVAEALAQIDQLSRGRLVFGAGVGYNEDFFRLFGVPKHRVGARFEECIRRAWTEERVTFEGEFFEFDDVLMTPKPYQRPRPPVWIGAMRDKAIRRALDWEGWCWWFPRQIDAAYEKVSFWRDEAEQRRGDSNWTVALCYEGWIGDDSAEVRAAHAPRWDPVTKLFNDRGLSPEGAVTDPQDSWLILGDSDYWVDRIGQVVDRVRPDWICIRTRTPGTADGPRRPSYAESLEVIERLGRDVIRHFQH